MKTTLFNNPLQGIQYNIEILQTRLCLIAIKRAISDNILYSLQIFCSLLFSSATLAWWTKLDQAMLTFGLVIQKHVISATLYFLGL